MIHFLLDLCNSMILLRILPKERLGYSFGEDGLLVNHLLFMELEVVVLEVKRGERRSVKGLTFRLER